MNITRDEQILASVDSDDNGHTFKVVTRNRPGDKVRMIVLAEDGSTVKDWGSHVSIKGALKFAASRGFSRQVCTNCDQWRTPDCYNECAKRGLTHY
tara:strand:+ start:410 stop:697 length:288 start_codon:yes stop_codon:yes gene_type:complete